MRAVDLIAQKREGGTHSSGEIEFLIQGYLAGDIPDYQMSAWLMAVCFAGLSAEETLALTSAMARSGRTLDLTAIGREVVDKHSTGGVGDKTSLIVVPLVAAAGLPIAKMSGRGLAHTGGTLDKLESIPGFSTDLSRDRFVAQLIEHGMVIAAQTEDLAPADKKLYALRDATSTVASVPLIAASVMSKKLAAGASAVLLDIKVGSGAFMKTLGEAEKLAATMVAIGKGAGKKTQAVISAMDEPLGRAVGNALEVEEAIAVLRGEGPADLVDLCLELSGRLLQLGGAAEDLEGGRGMARHLLESGEGLRKFARLIEIQRGDPRVVEHPDLLPKAPLHEDVVFDSEGYLVSVDAEEIGRAAMVLGAGRKRMGERIDPAAGLIVRARLGDRVRSGMPYATLHTARVEALAQAKEMVLRALSLGEERAGRGPLVYGTFGP